MISKDEAVEIYKKALVKQKEELIKQFENQRPDLIKKLNEAVTESANSVQNSTEISVINEEMHEIKDYLEYYGYVVHIKTSYPQQGTMTLNIIFKEGKK